MPSDTHFDSGNKILSILSGPSVMCENNRQKFLNDGESAKIQDAAFGCAERADGLQINDEN